jgi:hypothetical protein
MYLVQSQVHEYLRHSGTKFSTREIGGRVYTYDWSIIDSRSRLPILKYHTKFSSRHSKFIDSARNLGSRWLAAGAAANGLIFFSLVALWSLLKKKLGCTFTSTAEEHPHRNHVGADNRP